MENWIISSLPPASGYVELPALSSEKGAARLAAAANVVGNAPAQRLAHEAGPYLLDDKLALRLKLQGLSLGRGGEISALSPNKWPAGVAPAAVPAEAFAVLLEAGQRRRFLAFLHSNGHPDIPLVDLIRLARHFFYEEPVKVAVPKGSR